MMINRSALNVLGIVGLVTAVLAVGTSSYAQTQNHSMSGDRQGAMTADQLRDRIRTNESMDAQLRGAMLDNLEECLNQGMTPDDIEVMFPRHGADSEMDAGTMLRMQQRVREMISGGHSPGLMLDKMREGHVKGVAMPMLERAVTRTETNMRRANEFLGGMDSAAPDMDAGPQHRQMLERHLALNMWSGLEDGDLDHLRDRSRMRDHSMSRSDLVSATDVLTVARQRGMDRGDALDLVGDAIEAGYTHREMRMLGSMMTAAGMDDHGDKVREHLRDGMDHHREFAEMADEMMSWGWMGPADMDQAGGWHSMMDDWLGGGPGDHGGMGGMGGMGDGDDRDGHGGMGGSGGGMGGN
jgi:hypothetical protein